MRHTAERRAGGGDYGTDFPSTGRTNVRPCAEGLEFEAVPSPVIAIEGLSRTFGGICAPGPVPSRGQSERENRTSEGSKTSTKRLGASDRAPQGRESPPPCGVRRPRLRISG